MSERFALLAPLALFTRRRERTRAPLHSAPAQADYWAADIPTVAAQLHTDGRGLTTADASARRDAFGRNLLQAHARASALAIVLRQCRSPLLLLLLLAAALSLATGEWVDASLVLVIVAVTVTVGAVREYGAASAADALRAQLQTRATVVRDGRPGPLDVVDIVPGDVVLLSAGSLVPADGLLVEATDFFVSEALLTGESFPVHKQPGVVATSARVTARTNCVWLGTNVRSGSARCLVVATGASTELGRIAHRLELQAPETQFDRGIRQFGYLLSVVMLVLVLLVVTIHVLMGRPPVDTLLFAVALAVGLSPELLPAILGVNLSHGARSMAERGVLVRRLSAIENLGSMDILCTDKTGTLTEGVVRLEGAYDPAGQPSTAVLDLAACNAALETGITSPLDEAILAARPQSTYAYEKRGEIPFDFVRKRVTIAVSTAAGAQLITKGAFAQVIAICDRLQGDVPLDAEARAALVRQHDVWGARGIRVLAVATRALDTAECCTRDCEHSMVFAGSVTFMDRPKAGVDAAIAGLAAAGVTLKLITGDNRLVARHIAGLVRLSTSRLLTGDDLDQLPDEALWRLAEETDLFVEVDPNQKERIIRALRRMGHVVGFLGDGVNDAAAMHAADTSLSVAEAVDVAREAADFVLLQRDLDVIRYGINEGRRTFANTLKYILITTSANLGNMVSMALTSLVLPFLPLTAGQILLNNLLSDVPAVGLASDRVDPELTATPQRWDIRFVGRYMVQFGLLSSLFDVLTFAVLLGLFRADVATFRTAWFIESLLTELVVALVIRTRRRFYRSQPGRLLVALTAAMMGLALMMPYLPGATAIGFVPLPPGLLLVVIGVAVSYSLATEWQKGWFYGP
jgi:Mg2+-importing ATPase